MIPPIKAAVMKYYLNFFFTLSILFSAAVTRQASAQDTSEIPIVNIDFKAVSLGRGISGFGYIEDGKKQPFYVPSLAMSEERKYRGSQQLRFVRTVKTEQGKQEVPTASILLPEGQKKVLILFAQSPENPDKFLTKALPYMDEDFPVNWARVFNYSGRDLTVGLNGAVEKLASWQDVTVPIRDNGVALFIPRLNKVVQDQADLCREIYRAADGGRITLIIMRAPSASTNDEEALVVIPLIDSPIEPVSGENFDEFWKQ